ncbi:MAG: integrin alpha, partial [Planctomycetota bacterium JB042]
PEEPVDLTVTTGGGVAVLGGAFRFHDVRLLPVDGLPLPSSSPARSVAFVGWRHGVEAAGTVAIGRPDAPAGARILAHRPGVDAEPEFLDPWFWMPPEFELGAVLGLECDCSPYFGASHPGLWGPEIVVGSRSEVTYGTVAGAIHAKGSWAGGSLGGLFPHDEFGATMAAAVDGDADGVAEVLLVGAPGSGRVYAVGAILDQLCFAQVFASAEFGDRHGGSVAATVVGDEVYGASGAPRADPAGVADAGTVHLHRLSAPFPYGPTYLGSVDGTEPQQNAGPFGEAMPIVLLAPAAKSGRPLLIVGHPGADGRRGRVDAVDTETGTTLWSRGGLDPDDGFGHALVAIEDLDGDGVEDLVVGAPGEEAADSGPVDAGAAHVLSGATGAEVVRFDGESEGERFGSAVFRTTDVDHDLRDELWIATDAATAANVLRRFSVDPRRHTVETAIGADLDGQLHDASDLDGLSIPLADGEELECRLYGVHSPEDPLVLVLFDDAGVALASTAAVPPGEKKGPPGVKRMKDHWRLRYEAGGAGTVHLLVGAPRAAGPRPYVLATDRIGKVQVTVKEKAKVPAGDASPVEFGFPGVPGAFAIGEVECAGATIESVDLVDEGGASVTGAGFWAIEKGGHRAVLGDDCVPTLTDQEYRLVVHPSPPAKKAKLKAKLHLVKPLDDWTMFESE